MLRVDIAGNKLIRLSKIALADIGHWERRLQDMICADPTAFCEEIGEKLLVVGQEVRPSESIPDRIDILAIDDRGRSVVVELKRGSHKLHLLQAISYAGMVSGWPIDKFIGALASGSGQASEEAMDAIREHIGSGSEISSINYAQRIVLIAEEFDPAVLIAGEWLHEKYDVDIRCYRLEFSREAEIDYLTCARVYPPVEIAALTRGASKPLESASGWSDWAAALSGVEAAVRDFFLAELSNNQESRMASRTMLYRIGGPRRFWLVARKRYAYVWQEGRFKDDETFWRKRVSEPNYTQEVNGAQSLRFRLITAADFQGF